MAGAPIDTDAGAARRERTNPILRPASDSPTARVTQLAFGGAKDDLRLYASGEDKVVRVWSIRRDKQGKTLVESRGQLLWPIYRDRVGAILAMRVFRLQGREYLAIGGIGVKTSQVNVIDVDDPDRTAVLLHPEVSERRNQAVFAIDAHESAGLLAVGHDSEPQLEKPRAKVLLWQLQPERKLLRSLETRLLRARFVRFSPDGKRLAVAGNLASGAGGGIETFDVASGKPASLVELKCDDRQTLAADYVVKGLRWRDDAHWQAATIAGDVSSDDDVRSTLRPGFRYTKAPNGGRQGKFAHRDALAGTLSVRLAGNDAARDTTLAVGKSVTADQGAIQVRVEDRWVPFPGGVSYETQSWTLALAGGSGSDSARAARDLFHGKSRVVDEASGSALWSTDGWITALATSEGGDFVAAAELDGKGPAIHVWDRQRKAMIATMPEEAEARRGAMPINYVRIATMHGGRTDEQVLFGAGDFDPFAPSGRASQQFQLEYPRALETFDAKRFAKDERRWKRLNAKEAAAYLPPKATIAPLCGIAFTANKQSYAALGFPAGIEVRAVERAPAGARLVRKFYGHSAAVASLDVSTDGDWLLSGSVDGTLCAWSLRGLEQANELGVTFANRGGGVVVEKVIDFLPGWEAGFTPGQKVAAVKVAGNALPAAKWFDALSRPTPGEQLYVEATLAGAAQAMISPVARDPLWTLYPQRDGNWILWTPQGYFDSSPGATSRFEWHVNLGGESTGARTFLAQDFRDQFRKRPVIDAVVRFRDVAKALAEAPSRVAPSEVAIRVAGLVDGGVAPTLATKIQIDAGGGTADRPISELQVWLNGRRLALVKRTANDKRPSLAASVEVTPELFRSGANMLVAVAVSDDSGARLNTRRVVRFTNLATSDEKPRLHYLGVGVTALDAEPQLKRLLDIGQLKYAAQDALALEKALREKLIASGQYSAGKLVTLAEGGAAPPTRVNILAALRDIAKVARPNDFVLVLLAGHGFDEAPSLKGDDPQSGFYFVAKDTTTDLRPTALTAETLHATLSQLACPSLVLLDACHAAAVHSQDEQLLDLGGLQLGPQIVTACGRAETSKEHDAIKHGLFTYAALEALGAAQANADIRQQADDGRPGMSVDEFCRYVKLRTPQLLSELVAGEKRGDAQRESQNPEVLSSLTFDATRVLLVP